MPVEFFHREVLPLIWQIVPDCRFSIIGYGADRFAALGQADERIEIAANVPDVRPYLARAWVVVVPLRTGSGTRLKILDAMAMGKAVVSTKIGAEGIAAEGDALVIADGPAQFAAAALGLLGQPRRRQALGAIARARVEGAYSWRVATEMCDQMTALIAPSKI